MSALTASVDDAAVDYVHQPVNFGRDDQSTRTAEEDAFRAGAAWAEKHIDWRVLSGAVPGQIYAGVLRLRDEVVVAGVEGTVTSLQVDHSSVSFVVTTDQGAEIAFHRPRGERVLVLGVGGQS